MDDDDLEEISMEEIEAENQIYHLYGSLGLFIAAFSKVDLALTVLLATLCKQTDFNSFHIVTKGLDARAKVGRVRELCEIKGLIRKGDDFDKRLEMFTSKINNFRNLIAHSFLTLPTDKAILAFYNISYLTLEPKVADSAASGEAIDFYTAWADGFFNDLLEVIQCARTGKVLSIDHPQSLEPMDFHQKIDALNRAAKLDISPRIATRKSE